MGHVVATFDLRCCRTKNPTYIGWDVLLVVQGDPERSSSRFDIKAM
jgi:hypothetical protein